MPDGDEKFDLPWAISEVWPPQHWQKVTVLVAVSGGADSVALLRAMAELKADQRSGRLVVAHFNHLTRGAASDGDEQFVTQLSESLGLDFNVGHAQPESTPATDEQSWRAERYRYLERLGGDVGARYIATAHTADDQAETILHRIIRGTGVAGLAGIPLARTLGHASLIRPMLGVRRQEVLAYLQNLGQTYRTDASNANRRFMRNRIRHELLPLLVNDFNPQAVDALLRLGRVASDAHDALNKACLDELYRESVKLTAEGGVSIDCECLAARTPFLIHETLIRAYREQGWPLQPMGQTQWELLGQMLRSTAADTSPIMLPGAIRATRLGSQLVLQPTDIDPTSNRSS